MYFLKTAIANEPLNSTHTLRKSHLPRHKCWNNRYVSVFVWICVYVCVLGWKYSWHNIIGRGPYGKLAASYLSLSSLEAKISTSLFVALSWTPTTVIGLIIKEKTAQLAQLLRLLFLFPSFSLSLTFCPPLSVPLPLSTETYQSDQTALLSNHLNLTIRNCINIT